MDFDASSRRAFDFFRSFLQDNNSDPTLKPDFNGSNFPLAGGASALAFASDSSSSSKAAHKSTPSAPNNGSLAKNPHHFHQLPNDGSTCTNPFVEPYTTGFSSEVDPYIPSWSFTASDHLQGCQTDPCWDFSQPLQSPPEIDHRRNDQQQDQTPPPTPPPVAPKVVVEASAADQDKMDKNNNNRRVLKSKKLNRPVKKTNSGKVLWTHDEDRLLKHLVNKYGTKRWTEIAKKLQGREGKQCRERWHNHLRPHIKKDLWSEEEEMILIAAHKEMGNKWAEMVKILPGRTENTIKNHWNAAKRRQDTKRKSKDGTAAKPSLLAKYINSLSSTSASTSALMLPLPPQHYKEKTVLEIMNPETSTNPHLVQLENPGFNPTEFDYSFYANVFNDQLDPSFGSIFGEGSNIGMENFELPLEMDSLKKDSDFLEMICQGNL